MRAYGHIAAALATLALVAGRSPADAAPTGKIKVLPQATVAGPVLRLSDLAVVDGSASDLAQVELGPAPEPGTSRRISGQTLLARLRESGLDDSVTYSIPTTVNITRAHQLIDETALRPVIEAQLGERLPPGDRIDVVEVQRPVRIAVGAYDVDVGEPSARGTGGGYRRTDVRILQDGSVVATVAARVKIASFGPVVVARQPIARGTVLRAEDLRVEELRLDELPNTVVSEVDDVVGKEARVALAAGKPVTVQALATAPLVKRGDAVRMIIEKGGLRLSVTGEALETGGAGERVRVVNDSSKRELVGQVIAHGTVHVVY